MEVVKDEKVAEKGGWGGMVGIWEAAVSLEGTKFLAREWDDIERMLLIVETHRRPFFRSMEAK